MFGIVVHGQDLRIVPLLPFDIFVDQIVVGVSGTMTVHEDPVPLEPMDEIVHHESHLVTKPIRCDRAIRVGDVLDLLTKLLPCYLVVLLEEAREVSLRLWRVMVDQICKMLLHASGGCLLE